MYRTSWFDEFNFFEKVYGGRHLKGFELSSVIYNLKKKIENWTFS